MKQRLKLLSLIFNSVLLVSCGSATPASTVTIESSITPTPKLTNTPSPSFTPVSPTPGILPATSTPTSLPVSSPPNGLRMAYILDGNLYFQEGSNPAVQLTHSGEDWNPIFSDDGEKIVFFRGKDWEKEEIHSINSDGSQEQVLVTNQLLMAFDNLYSKSTRPSFLIFVPGTHLLLIATQESLERWNGDLLAVDADSAEIKGLFPPGQMGNFYVSPDGKFIAVDRIGRIDVTDVGGKIVRQNLLTYTPSEPNILSPGIYWMPDSTGLTVLLPVPTYYEGNEPPEYTVWRYALDGSPGIQISLDPLPGDHTMAQVSPDGNWVIYNSYQQNAFYIGNLHTSHTELYESQFYIYHYDWSWSPDSAYFVYMKGGQLYLGSPTDSPELIGQGVFQGWIDSNRFLYHADKNIVMGDVTGLKQILLAGHETFKNRTTIFTFILPKAQER